MKQKNRKAIERELELAIDDEMYKAELQAGEEAGLMSMAHPHPEAIYPLIKNYLIKKKQEKYIGVRY